MKLTLLRKYCWLFVDIFGTHASDEQKRAFADFLLSQDIISEKTSKSLIVKDIDRIAQSVSDYSYEDIIADIPEAALEKVVDYLVAEKEKDLDTSFDTSKLDDLEEQSFKRTRNLEIKEQKPRAQTPKFDFSLPSFSTKKEETKREEIKPITFSKPAINTDWYDKFNKRQQDLLKLNKDLSAKIQSLNDSLTHFDQKEDLLSSKHEQILERKRLIDAKEFAVNNRVSTISDPGVKDVLDHLNEKYEYLRSHEDRINHSLKHKKTILDKYETHEQNLRESVRKLETQENQLRSTLSELEVTRNALINDIDSRKSQLHQLENMQKEAQSRHEELQESAQLLQQRMSKEQQQLEQDRHQLAQTVRDVEQLRKDLLDKEHEVDQQRFTLENDLEEKRRQLEDEMEQKSQSLESQINEQLDMIQREHNKLREFQDALNKQQQLVSDREGQLKRAYTNYEDKMHALMQKEKELREIEQELAQKHQMLNDKEKQVRDLVSKELTELDTDYNTRLNMIKQYEQRKTPPPQKEPLASTSTKDIDVLIQVAQAEVLTNPLKAQRTYTQIQKLYGMLPPSQKPMVYQKILDLYEKIKNARQ